MSNSLRLAVFDVDGTLVDSQHNIVAAMTEAWRGHGLPDPKPDAVRRIIGLSLVEAIAALAPEAAAEDHVRLAHAYKDAFFTLRQRPNHSEPLYDGALDALAALEADGWLLGLATGKSYRGVAALLDRHGLNGRFVTIQTADDNPGKPHPAMLTRAVAEAGAEVVQTVMIGDTTFDMMMAKSAKVAAVGVAWGYHATADLIEAGAERLVEAYPAVPMVLDALLKERQCASAAI